MPGVLLTRAWCACDTCFMPKEVRQSDDHTRARGFVAKSEDGEGRLSFNVNGKYVS